MTDDYILKLDTNIKSSDLKARLDNWAPWGHRIDFSNGVSTRDCNRRNPFSENTLQKLSMVEECLNLDNYKGGRLLDIGCNSGYNSIHCAQKYNFQTTGIDVSTRHIEVSNFLKEIASVKGEFLLESAETFSRPNNFDVILHFGTLYHLPNPLLSLQTNYNNLVPGGHIAIETQVYDNPEDDSYCYFMHMHNNDRTNFWALSTKVLTTILELFGYVEIIEIVRTTPKQLANHMHRAIFLAKKPA